MTKSQEIYRKKLLAMIHLHPFHKHAVQEGAWDVFLQSWGVCSCAELNIKELVNVLAVMDGKATPRRFESAATAPQVFAIRNAWQSVAVNVSETALLAFVGRIIKQPCADVSKLSKKQASWVIAALRKMREAR